MKKIVVSLLLSIICNGVFAQTNEKAESLLKEVSANMTSFGTMQFKFKYTLENKEVDVHQESMGTAYTKANKYNLLIMGNTMIFDGSKTYIISNEDEEINISEEENDFLTPNKLLFFYQDGYTFSWDETKTIDGKLVQFVKLVPISSESESSHFIIAVYPKTKTIKSVTNFGNNGTQTIIEILDFKANQVLPQNIFTFDRTYYEKKDYVIND
ncbi:LolA family protein [Flavicella sediminum]|uniref:LolA family protein n=1 Tax=Flavicella sediminum TaxID=2585141 RepID=UPI00112276AC|nr:outer membrane lipoprotein carrier protein LolA [Flavicella sediminum]